MKLGHPLGRRLVFMDLARSWLDAERVRSALKRLDRLLGNHRLHAERGLSMAGWCVGSCAVEGGLAPTADPDFPRSQ